MKRFTETSDQLETVGRYADRTSNQQHLSLELCKITLQSADCTLHFASYCLTETSWEPFKSTVSTFSSISSNSSRISYKFWLLKLVSCRILEFHTDFGFLGSPLGPYIGFVKETGMTFASRDRSYDCSKPTIEPSRPPRSELSDTPTVLAGMHVVIALVINLRTHTAGSRSRDKNASCQFR